MASPLALRTPTCLTCLRRLMQPARPAVFTQLRGKKTKARLVVQLTDDIPGWGPKGNFIRISRELMRVVWYPSGKMRYVTPVEWKAKGYVEEDITIRQRDFALNAPDEVVEEEEFYDPIAEDMAKLEAKQQSEPRHQIEVEQLEPARALELLNQFIPATLTFERRLVHTEGIVEKPLPEPSVVEEEPSASAAAASAAEPTATTTTDTDTATATAKITELSTPSQSGFAARRAKLAAEQEAEAAQAARIAADQQRAEQARTEQQVDDRRKIHGSVSTANIAQQIRERMLLDPEAARIQIGAEDVAFIDHGDEAEEPQSKVEKIGVYEVKITPRVGKTKLDPVWRTIEVMPNRAGGEAETVTEA